MLITTQAAHDISRWLECDRSRAQHRTLVWGMGSICKACAKKQRDKWWSPRRRRITTGGKGISVPELRSGALPLNVTKHGFQESRAACRTNSKMERASNWYRFVALLAWGKRCRRCVPAEKFFNIQTTSASTTKLFRESVWCTIIYTNENHTQLVKSHKFN